MNRFFQEAVFDQPIEAAKHPYFQAAAASASSSSFPRCFHGCGSDHYANDELPSTLNVRPLNNSQLSGIGEYDASAQPLSTGAVRPLESSQISGPGDHYASSQPPSAGAVRQ
ncbi:hypothetical protein R6Q59_003118 [Mikania micrantha]